MSRVDFDLDRIGGLLALRGLISAVIAAGDAAQRLYLTGAHKHFERKPDRSPVSAADKQVEQHLKSYCAKHFPDIAFLGEESAPQPEPLVSSAVAQGRRPRRASAYPLRSLPSDKPHAQGHHKLRFVVDPIDGTRAFLRGVPTWSVLCGLEEHRDGSVPTPVLGIAFMPAREELFVAVRGAGAECNGRPLRVSGIERLEDSLICHGGLEQFRGSEPLLLEIAHGSDAVRGFADFDGYRHVLFGKAEAMVDPDTKPWDLCVPSILVTEAGGEFSDFSGARSHYGGAGLASNQLVHQELLGSLQKAAVAISADTTLN